MVIRNIVDLVRSGYLKKIRYGDYVFDFDEYFSRALRTDITKYFEIGHRWASIFGWSSMEIRVLDSRYLVNGDLVDDFVTLLRSGTGIDATGFTVKGPPRNISPGWKTVEAVRALYSGRSMVLRDNHPLVQAIRDPALRRAVGNAAKRVGDKLGWNSRGSYLTREQAALCFELYTAAIEAFNRSLPKGLPLPDSLETCRFRTLTRPPAADMIPTEALNEFYEELWQRISGRTAPDRETGIPGREVRSPIRSDQASAGQEQ
jgi:hypothetical protein